MWGDRTWRVYVPALALCACGRIGFDELSARDAGDSAMADAAPTDAAPACAAFGPWDLPVAITQVNSDRDEFGPTLTSDGLTLLFTSARPGGEGNFDLYQATRPSPAEPFSVPRNLTALNTADTEDGPTVTSDGLTLYFCRASGSECQLYRATRPDLFADFGDAQPVPSLPDAWGPSITAAGTELFYTIFDAGGEGDILRATVSGTTIEPAGLVSELNDGGHQGFTTLSADGLTMLFEADSGSELAIHTASRTAIGAPFEGISVFDLGDGSTDDSADPALSNGDRTLVFARDEGTGNGYDVFITNRSCL